MESSTSSTGSQADPAPTLQLPPGSTRYEAHVELPARPHPASRSDSDSESLTSISQPPSLGMQSRSGLEQSPRDLLIFTCSPTISPLPLDAEAAGASRHFPLAADIRHQRGGTPALLTGYLLQPTRMFLFAGHADLRCGPASSTTECTLGFTDPSGGLVALDIPALVEILRTVQELVFLNGCRSEQLGQHLCDAGVPVVICWRTPCH